MAEVTLPQLGETVTEGTITQWFKQIGDTVAADEPLFEVSTDKVDTEVPSPVAGTLTEIRVQEGETVDVGTIIAVVGDGDGDGAAPAAAPPAAEEQPAAASPVEPEAEPEQAEDGQAPAAEPAEQPAPEPEPATAEEAPAEPAAAPAPASDAPAAPRGDAAKGILLSPVVRRLVNEHGLDPTTINGSGPGGRITRDDVLDHIDKTGSRPEPAVSVTTAIEPTPADEEGDGAPTATEARQAPAAPPAPTAPAPARTPAAGAPKVAPGQRDESIPLTKIRKLTGQHMIMSKGVSPHAFSVVEVDFANVDKTRLAIKDEWRKTEGFSLTYLPFISRATIDALLEFPHMNASVGENDLVIHRFVDLGIAVDLDYEGLIVPVIRDAEDLRLRAIARHINDLAARARTKKLMPDEISGGTFTISNNGSAGSVLTMPIINQPQVAILSTDAITRKPVVVATTDGGEAIAIHPVGNLAMAWDHRAFDGAYAANFLRRIKEILESRDWSSEV
jgi:pyruvate dehydrogenase E2 component (dihydrolipoyllysine-residue acetyltransferase)